MGKSKKTKTHSTSTESNALDAGFKSAVYGNLNDAKARAASFQPYTGQRVADLNPTQLQSQQNLLNLANQDVGAGNRASAAAAATKAASYTPTQVTGQSYNPVTAAAAQMNRGDVRDISSGPISADAIRGYQDPFQQDVIDAAMADLERQRQIRQTYLKADAVKNNAFGGTGSAVAAGLADEDFTRQAATASAGLRSQGYQQALAAAQADAGRALQAASANQSADLSVAGQNSSLMQQANLFNAGAGTDAARFAAEQNFNAQQLNQAADQAGAGIQLQAGGLFGSLADQERAAAFENAGLIESVGDKQYAVDNAKLEAAFDSWLKGQQLSLEQQQLVNQAMGLVPAEQTISGASSGTQKAPGGGLGSLISTGASLLSMCDRRLKTDVEPFGEGRGHRWYRFRYLSDHPSVRRIGVMAQDVLATRPAAVSVTPSGYLAVDYAALLA